MVANRYKAFNALAYLAFAFFKFFAIANSRLAISEAGTAWSAKAGAARSQIHIDYKIKSYFLI